MLERKLINDTTIEFNGSTYVIVENILVSGEMKKYNMDLYSNRYSYLINNVAELIHDEEKEEPIEEGSKIVLVKRFCKIYRIEKDSKGIQYLKKIFCNLYKCTICGNYFLAYSKPGSACKSCAVSMNRSLYTEIPPEHKDQFVDLVKNMHSRCYNPANPRYQIYSSKGITVYDGWRAYNCEISDAERAEKIHKFYKYSIELGWKPGLEIDRIDNNKGYYPGNIRFITLRGNVNNRSTTLVETINGISKSRAGWARFIGKKPYELQTIVDKYDGSVAKAYYLNLELQRMIDFAIKELKEKNIDRDRDFLEEFTVKQRCDSTTGLLYRGIVTSKSNWARAMDGKISPNTLDDALRRHGNSIEKLIEYSENNEMTHDYKALFDYAIDSGKIYEMMKQNRGTSPLFEFMGLKTSAKVWSELLQMGYNTVSILCSRNKYNFESLFRYNGRFYYPFLDLLKYKPNLFKDLENRIFYNNKPLNSSDFNPEKFLQAYENWISTGIWELDSNPSSSTSTSTIGDIIINIAGSIFTEILNDGKFLCDRNKTITMNERFSGKNIIIASNGKQYLVK